MTIADLIEKLKTKDQDTDVQFIIVKTDGELVAAVVSAEQAKPMIKVLKRFG